jgi:isocitrate dehydrogenase
MPNLYGDIISDITAQISGSIGLAGTANAGENLSMFEAIHGSAPDIAGKDVANPSGLLRAAVLMLNHLGQQDVAERIINAWSTAIEKGLHTADIYRTGLSSQKLGTKAFAQAVIAHLGEKPKQLQIADFDKEIKLQIKPYQRKEGIKKTLKGVDVFVDWKGKDANALASNLQKLNSDIKLSMITNRGVKVWPEGFEETFCTDHWRCRFELEGNVPAQKSSIHKLMAKALDLKIDIIKTENLYEFDGVRGYSLGQGQ